VEFEAFSGVSLDLHVVIPCHGLYLDITDNCRKIFYWCEAIICDVNVFILVRQAPFFYIQNCILLLLIWLLFYAWKWLTKLWSNRFVFRSSEIAIKVLFLRLLLEFGPQPLVHKYFFLSSLEIWTQVTELSSLSNALGRWFAILLRGGSYYGGDIAMKLTLSTCRPNL
jgi:hypothetical protein